VAAVESAVAADGAARVIVLMRAPVKLEAGLSASAVQAQRAAIATSLDGLEETLTGTGSKKLNELEVVPSAVYEVTDAGLDALLADPDVASVTLDGQVSAELATSTGVIDSDLLNTAGVLGNNFEGATTGAYQVAIIDSGVDGQHNAFTGRIVRQACFVTDSSCPGGTNASVGAPSGEECTHSTDCDHGTHVGGIAAGSFFTGGHEGVARGAGIVAVKVAQDNPSSARWTAFFSAIDSGLQHIINLKNSTNPNLVSVNLSIGTGTTFTNGTRPATRSIRPPTSCSVNCRRWASPSSWRPATTAATPRCPSPVAFPMPSRSLPPTTRTCRRASRTPTRDCAGVGAGRQHRRADPDRRQPWVQGRHVDGDPRMSPVHSRCCGNVSMEMVCR
jgi:hypothetical protein